MAAFVAACWCALLKAHALTCQLRYSGRALQARQCLSLQASRPPKCQAVPNLAVAHRPWRRASAGGPLVEERPGGLLPLRSWLALWAALAAASPRKCLEHLLLLGYAGEPGALLAPSRPRRVERGLPTGPARGVFQVPPAVRPVPRLLLRGSDGRPCAAH